MLSVSGDDSEGSSGDYHPSAESKRKCWQTDSSIDKCNSHGLIPRVIHKVQQSITCNHNVALSDRTTIDCS